MSKIILHSSLLIVLIACAVASHAQGQRTSGGNHLWVTLKGITPCEWAGDTIVLNKGQSYAAEIEAGSEFNSEEDFYVVAVGQGIIGKLERTQPSAAHYIPINILPLPGGLNRLILYVQKLSLEAHGEVEVYIRPSVGIVNIEKENTINIYPNPATDKLIITGTGKITNVAISNMYGQVVYTRACNTEKAEVDIKALPAGIYYVNLQKGDNVVTKCFTKGE